MRAEEVLSFYKNSRHTLQVTEKLNSGGNPFIFLRGLAGSSAAFAISSVLRRLPSQHFHLFILPDKEEAAYFFNDLQSLNGENSVLFFPSSYKRPYQAEETDNANVLQRAEILNAIIKNSQPSPSVFLIVTYAGAIAEKVVTRSHLLKNTLHLRQGEKLPINFAVELFSQYGFERKDFVTEPGQFSVRGGIIDIYSFANDLPCRVEFFGEEVETIRSFDPATQLSVKKHDAISIIPDVENKLLRENRQSFPEFMPDNTVLWVKETALCFEKLQKEYEAAEKIFAERQGELLSHLPPAELFIDKHGLENLLKQYPVVEFGQQHYFEPQLSIHYNITPQPVFNKNFDLLFETLKKQSAAGYRNIIAADNPKQAERLLAIFDDLGKGNESTESLVTTLNCSIYEGFIDRELMLACFTDHQVFERYHRFRLNDSFYRKKEALTLKELKNLNPGDYITHIDHGIGRFGGLEKIEAGGKIQEAIRLVYKDNDILYIGINSLHRISKYAGKEGAVPRIDKLGSNAWQNLKQKTKRKVKEIAFDLLRLYAKRKSQKGFAFSPDTYLQHELEASFIYEDTPDQLRATNEVKQDMESESPMDRLICGDVGFGKTEIAIRAAFKAVCDSKQVAVLVPTTILALQHYKTFTERLKGFPCTVDYINRFKSRKQQKETLEKLAEGKIDILIGTHKLVGRDIIFRDLGLLIVDEEQKFGVAVKDKLKTLKTNVDTLTLTATPIPRTLQFSMMGARDLSIITTPPPNRYPIHTEVHNFNEEIIRDAIYHEVSRGGQVFFVHNRVNDLTDMAGKVKRLCPDARVGIGHGRMKGEDLEKVMLDFIEGNYDVLVSTTIVESGLDISNANTIIINEAHHFGLSDLHQMRGRVGRTNKKAYCYLFIPSFSALTDEARKRLKAIEQFSDLGSGFNIAMRDLDIRGAGNLLGAEQSGFITEIGYEMYQKILDEAIEELKEEMAKKDQKAGEKETVKRIYPEKPGEQDVRALIHPAKDCSVETDLEILIPDSYVSNITERLSLYRELDDSKSEDDLQKFRVNITDRFGQAPAQVLELIDTVRLRWMAMETGIEKLFLKNKKLTAYFISDPKSPFYQSGLFTKILQSVQKNPGHMHMRQFNNKLSVVFDNVSSIAGAKTALASINGVPG